MEHTPGKPFVGAKLELLVREGAGHIGELRAWDLDGGGYRERSSRTSSSAMRVWVGAPVTTNTSGATTDWGLPLRPHWRVHRAGEGPNPRRAPVIRYEDAFESGGLALCSRLGHVAAWSVPLKSRNDSAL